MSPYALLGVPADASLEDIEAGYRSACEALRRIPGGGLRHRWHRWRLDRAYRLLRDPASRQAWDANLPMIEMLGRCPPGLL